MTKCSTKGKNRCAMERDNFFLKRASMLWNIPITYMSTIPNVHIQMFKAII